MTDACRPALRTDALINQRTLFEPFDKAQDRLLELARPPKAGVRPLQMRLDGASLALGPFAPQQRLRPSGRAK